MVLLHVLLGLMLIAQSLVLFFVVLDSDEVEEEE